MIVQLYAPVLYTVFIGVSSEDSDENWMIYKISVPLSPKSSQRCGATVATQKAAVPSPVPKQISFSN